MAESNELPAEESTRKAALLLMQALDELQRTSPATQATLQARADLSAASKALQQVASRFEQQMMAETEQRIQLAGQLTNLATSLNHLVGHLQDLGNLMTGMLDHMNEGTPVSVAEPEVAPTPEAPPEPAFLPGGEGISLNIAGVPGFQALMDIQKAIVALKPVAGASVERFQEGDSRILVHLKASMLGTDLAAELRSATGQTLVVEESRPELMSLRLRILPA